VADYASPTPPPGWYPDPASGAPRYWDGYRWGAYWTPPYAAWPAPPAPSAGAATVAHLGFLVGGPLIPLIVYLVTDRSDSFTKVQAAEALNFQLTLFIVSFGAFAVLVPGALLTAGIALLAIVPLGVAAEVVAIVWCIKAAIAANRRQFWWYPFCFRMVKP